MYKMVSTSAVNMNSTQPNIAEKVNYICKIFYPNKRQKY
jgi:hypothetical protein